MSASLSGLLWVGVTTITVVLNLIFSPQIQTLQMEIIKMRVNKREKGRLKMRRERRNGKEKIGRIGFWRLAEECAVFERREERRRRKVAMEGELEEEEEFED
jgi:hypothetical protein